MNVYTNEFAIGLLLNMWAVQIGPLCSKPCPVSWLLLIQHQLCHIILRSAKIGKVK